MVLYKIRFFMPIGNLRWPLFRGLSNDYSWAVWFQSGLREEAF
jgi:hypothetical protein